MAEHAQSTIIINARPAAVMGAIADIAAYPTWVSQLEQAEILEVGADGRPRQARFRVNAMIVKDELVNSYTWKDDEHVSWSLISSEVMSSQDGSYTLRDLGDGRTEVTYDLTAELKIKLPGLLRRKIQSGIVDAAVKDLKKHVEKLVES